MSKATGQIIIANQIDHTRKALFPAAAAFKEAAAEFRSGREQISQKTLKKIFNVLEIASQAPSIPIFQKLISDNNHQTASLSSLGLSPSKSDPNQFVPIFESFYIAPTSLFHACGTIPVNFNSEHIEYKHIKRDAVLINYQNESFNRLVLSLALFCMTPFESLQDDSQEDSIQIPLDSGVLIGTTSSIDGSSLKTKGGGIHKNKKGLYFSSKPWLPDPWKRKASMKTYVGNGEIFQDQVALRSSFATENAKGPDTSQLLKDLIHTLTTIGPPEAEAYSRILGHKERLKNLSFIIK